MSGNLTYLVAATAIAGPLLLTETAKVVGVPVYVAPEQAGAMSVLRAPISFQIGVPFIVPDTAETEYTRNSVNSWLTKIVNFMGPFRPGSQRTAWGAYPVRGFLPTNDDADRLCTRMLEAVLAAKYDAHARVKVAAVRLAQIHGTMWSAVDGETVLGSDTMTPTLARAVMVALGELAVEMDDAGLLVTGKPIPTPTVLGGISHAAGATADWAIGLPVDLASKAAGITASLALSTTGMLAIAGYVIYRAVKS